MITLDMGENCIAAFGAGMQPLSIELPRGVLQAGRIQNADLVAELLAARLPAERGREQGLCFQLPSQIGQYREFSLPQMARSKVEAAIRLQYQGSVSNLEDYVLDYYEVAAEEAGCAYQCALVPRAAIAQYLALAKTLKRPCRGIALRQDALRRRAAAYGVTDAAFVVMMLLSGEAEVCLFEGKRAFVRPVQFQSDASRLAEWGIAIASGAQETGEQRASLLAQQADRLAQFQLSRNRDVPVAAVYAASFEPEDALIQTTSRILGREITALPLFSANADAVQAGAEKQAETPAESGAAV